MKNYRIAVQKDKNPANAVRQAIALIGGMNSFVKPGQKVMIKPNCVVQKYMPGTVIFMIFLQIYLGYAKKC